MPDTNFDTQVKLAIYRHLADTTRAPSLVEVAERVHASSSEVGGLRAAPPQPAPGP